MVSAVSPELEPSSQWSSSVAVPTVQVRLPPGATVALLLGEVKLPPLIEVPVVQYFESAVACDGALHTAKTPTSSKRVSDARSRSPVRNISGKTAPKGCRRTRSGRARYDMLAFRRDRVTCLGSNLRECPVCGNRLHHSDVLIPARYDLPLLSAIMVNLFYNSLIYANHPTHQLPHQRESQCTVHPKSRNMQLQKHPA